MYKTTKLRKPVVIIALLLLLAINVLAVTDRLHFDFDFGSGGGAADEHPYVEPFDADKHEKKNLSAGISANIAADGMSVNRAAPKPFELGISEKSIYCRDSYQFVPLCGSAVSWSSSNEEIATVNDSGLVTTHAAGSAVITASDAAGNTDACTVNVVKVVYVTIDDTPTEYTETLLDILDKYNVKATFFMNADPQMAHKYRMIYERGHMIALHGYRHATSYASGETFLQNMEDCRKFIMESTGCLSSDIDNVLRFPTGSKGQKNYREILEYIQYHDYSAFDWTTEFHDYYYHSASGCLEYFKTYLHGDRAVMLFHTREWSVAALPEALDYMIEQGYTFAPITRDTAQYNFYGLYI